MLIITPRAQAKIQEILLAQDPIPEALRIGVRGGGCSGFSYNMQFEDTKGPMDKEFIYPGDPSLTVYVDPISMMYLNGCEVDFLETLEASGFKFNNPNVTHCGCGNSFQV